MGQGGDHSSSDSDEADSDTENPQPTGDGDDDGTTDDDDTDTSATGGAMGDGDSAPSGDGDSDEPTSCEDEEVLCDDACVDPAKDEDFCGAAGDCQGDNAGQACESGFSCEDGQCRLICDEGLVACAAECIEPQSDEEHCGAANFCEGSTDEGEACSTEEACVVGSCATWGDREDIDLGGAGSTPWMELLTDGQGQATLLSQHKASGLALNVFASRPTDASNWLTDGPLYAADSSYRSWHDGHLVTNGSKQALLVGAEGESTQGGPYWSVTGVALDAGMNNIAETRLRPHGYTDIDDIAAALADDGTALVAWTRSSSSNDSYALDVRLRSSSGDWLTTETWIDAAPSETVLGALEVATRADNQAIVVWEQSSEDERELSWRRYANGGWFTPSSPLAELSDSTSDLSLVTNRKEGLYLSWSEQDSGAVHLMRYTDDVWSDLSLSHPSLAQATGIENVVLDSGDLLSLTNGADALDLSFYDAQTDTWTAGPSLPVELGPLTQMQAKADAEGNLFVVYFAPSSAGLWSARYDAGSQTWGEPVEIESVAVQHAALHVMPTGQALVAWDLPGDGQPFARRFQ